MCDADAGIGAESYGLLQHSGVRLAVWMGSPNRVSSGDWSMRLQRSLRPNSGRWVTTLLCVELHVADDGEIVGSTLSLFSGTRRSLNIRVIFVAYGLAELGKQLW
jgi:hypothetical protein